MCVLNWHYLKLCFLVYSLAYLTHQLFLSLKYVYTIDNHMNLLSSPIIIIWIYQLVTVGLGYRTQTTVSFHEILKTYFYWRYINESNFMSSQKNFNPSGNGKYVYIIITIGLYGNLKTNLLWRLFIRIFDTSSHGTFNPFLLQISIWICFNLDL